MAVAVSYPGVYIQEVPSGSRAIAGVPTSVAAFVGYTARGAVNDATQIFSFADFERRFGGLSLDSDLSYTVNHFFLNGGATAYIVRVASGASAASVGLLTAPGGTLTLTASAKSEGQWGNALLLSVDYATSNPASLFNLTVRELVERSGRLVEARVETHRNLSMNAFSGNYAVDAVSAASDLIELTNEGAAINGRGESRSGDLLALPAALGDDVRRLAVSLDGGSFYEFDIFDAGALPADLPTLAGAIQTRVRGLEPGNGAFDNFDCDIDSNQIRARSGTSNDQRSSVTFAPASIRSAAAALTLGLAHGGRETSAAASVRPAVTGTASDRIPDFAALVFADPEQMTVNLIDSGGTTLASETVTLQDTGAATPVNAPTTLDEARSAIEAAMRASSNPSFSQARVSVIDRTLYIVPGGDTASNRFEFTGAGAATLTLSNGTGGVPNVAAFQLGTGPTVQAQQAGTPGNDGSPPSPVEIQGSRAAKTGLFALEDADLFNMLNIPGLSDAGVLATAISYAEERRSMILIDMPSTVNDFDEARDWINDPANAGLRHRNAVSYFPRVRLADPLQGNRLRTFANAGLMAGLYARTDAARGVWKAPAGIEARLRGVQALEYVLSDPENGVLNPLGLNCLRTFPVTGSVSWGARTMVGADALASEWKYVPVRRIALFIEESLYRGTQFVVFEPNDEPLWAQIRLSVGAFMNNLFRQGAFQGSTPQEAYFVRCDSSTTTQADIDLGIVNIAVGFAPLKPAEFVVIQIQQLAGQSQA